MQQSRQWAGIKPYTSYQRCTKGPRTCMASPSGRLWALLEECLECSIVTWSGSYFAPHQRAGSGTTTSANTYCSLYV
ncbi:hypothetical protein KIN20_022623 [Parelaphostrongylus tenuis]|uniref:Uncharacterized protein n=1 Tax=Parelaphostrongylus tenuis TaxID=148309 RepID=A0AAD5QVB2_PARTN|nr:hypothetical protein KIN20_022623 [Parelaphostrongylus tenuis]